NMAPAPVPSRNMTPALAHGSVLPTVATPNVATRATMMPSPVSAWLAKLNWSDPPQMSAPPPLTVQLWPSGDDADPACTGPPTSASVHPAGRVDPVTATLVKVAVSRLLLLWAVTARPTCAVPLMATVCGEPICAQVLPSAE